jgi:phosphatidylglycerophosphate synthase
MVEDGSRLLLKSALRSILAATLLWVALAWLGHAIVDLGGSFIARTAVLLCIGALLFLRPLRAHHPFARVGLANQITMTRGVLVTLLLGLIGMESTPRLQAAALCVAMICSALDAVDGWAARRTQMSSAYGARFDMETDALLILALSILVWQFDKAGAWVLASGVMRYAFIGAARLLPWLQHPLPVSYRRKAVAVLQTVSLVIAVAPFVSRGVSGLLCAGALAVLLWSFLIDVAWLRRRTSDSMVVN